MEQARTTWRPAFPVDVRRTLSSLHRGPGDPTHRHAPDGSVWRTSRLPSGPVSYRIWQDGPREVHGAAWGPGAQELVDGVPSLLGADVDLRAFVPGHALVAQVHSRHPGVRIPRTGRVLESLVPSVLEQKVTGKQAREAFRWLVLRHGEPAPGPVPAGLRLPLPPEVWRRIPSWDWHRAGVEPARSRTVLAATGVAGRLEECAGLSDEAARTRLCAVPGIGPWTAAEVAQRALGDADTVSVGDYHLPAFVGWALTGRRVDDDGMLELLEPWRPYRYVVVRLLELSGVTAPRFGPRLAIQDHRRH